MRLSLSKRWPSRVDNLEAGKLLIHAHDLSYLPLESERPGWASRSPLSSLLGIQSSEVPQTISMWTPTSLLRKSWLYCILDLGLSRKLLEYDLTDVNWTVRGSTKSRTRCLNLETLLCRLCEMVAFLARSYSIRCTFHTRRLDGGCDKHVFQAMKYCNVIYLPAYLSCVIQLVRELKSFGWWRMKASHYVI